MTGVPAVARSTATTADRAQRSLAWQRTDSEPWFAVSPVGRRQAKPQCREQPWGGWSGEILDGGTLLPKRPRGTPRKSEPAGSR